MLSMGDGSSVWPLRLRTRYLNAPESHLCLKISPHFILISSDRVSLLVVG